MGVLEGLGAVLQPVVLVALLLGTAGGIFLGAQPDLNPAMGMALLLPLILGLPPETALLALAGLYCGSLFGGSIHAILSRVPGSPAHGMTVLDGYQMAKQGLAGQALVVSCVASAMGGLMSTASLIWLTPQVSALRGQLHGLSKVAFLVFALCVVSSLSSASCRKGMASGILGVALAFFHPALHPQTDFAPQMAGWLSQGLPIPTLLIGLFALPPLLTYRARRHQPALPTRLTKPYWPSHEHTLRMTATLFSSWIIGNLVGLLPGTGASVGARLAYRHARLKNEEAGGEREFGRGSPEGIVAAEAGNNAATGGALVAPLGLGIPGDGPTAVFLGGLLALGLIPGEVFRCGSDGLSGVFFAGFILIQLALVPIGLLGAPLFARAAHLPVRIWAPLVGCLSVAMAYWARGDWRDPLFLIPAALLGLIFRRLGWSLTPFLTGFYLAPLTIPALWQAPLSVALHPGQLFADPYSRIFYLLALAALLIPIIFRHFRQDLRLSLGAEVNLDE